MRSAVAAVALCLASNITWAAFVLTPSSSTVAAGGSFTATLSYVGPDALNWALDVTPLSASRSGFTLTGLTPLVALDSIVVGPTGVPEALPAYISAFINGPVGGSNVSVDLWQFDFAVDPTMALGAVTLFAEGVSADNDFNEILYSTSVDLQVVEGNVAPVPLPAAAWLLLSGLAGLGFVGRRRMAA
jgi:hypothetical protein